MDISGGEERGQDVESGGDRGLVQEVEYRGKQDIKGGVQERL